MNQVYRLFSNQTPGMKRILIALSLISMLSQSGCVKDTACTPKPVQDEQAVIINYALAEGINATAHSTGLYYEIINPGTGVAPTPNNNISVTYTGKLLDGTVFDSKTSPIQLSLGQAINGWQIGLPLIKEGGTIKLIIPSALAWGCIGAGSGLIPRDAVVYFEVTLVDVL
jgi:FKBP-type peptidyl-prolyl cis-trans isomerase